MTELYVVSLGAERKPNIILSIWKVQRLFDRIIQDIEASLTEVCVFSSVLDCVVVIPQSSCCLSVRVVIVFVLSRLGRVFGPTKARLAMKSGILG